MRRRGLDIQVVNNPRSGNGPAWHLLEDLLEALRARGHRPRVAERAGAGRRPAPPDCIVSIGGDDSASLVAPVAMRLDAPLVLVPSGFGNITPAELGHEAEIDSVVELIETGDEVRLDVGVLRRPGRPGESIFVTAESFGYLERVKRSAETGGPSRMRSIRWLQYVTNAFRALRLGSPLPALSVEVDGEMVTRGAVVAIVANLPVYPGYLMLAPEASPLDGRLDVCVVEARDRLQLLTHLASCLPLPGAHPWHPSVRRGECVRIGCRPSRGSRRAPRTVADITVRPAALPVLVRRTYRARERGLIGPEGALFPAAEAGQSR